MASCERRVPMLTTLMSSVDAIAVIDLLLMQLQELRLPTQLAERRMCRDRSLGGVLLRVLRDAILCCLPILAIAIRHRTHRDKLALRRLQCMARDQKGSIIVVPIGDKPSIPQRHFAKSHVFEP